MSRHTMIILSLLLISAGQLTGQVITREEYIETYSELAMKEMERTGIPASITLAQGCLESDNGNSSLAVAGNNHFGIKCHNDWNGGRIYHDDDAQDECFRKYKSAYDSYKDHSAFLTEKDRYAFLFDLRPGDYKAWARGLQKAGYATSNKYSGLLIRIIEENELHKYDRMVLAGTKQGRKDRTRRPAVSAQISKGERTIYQNNRIDYIIVEEGDTPEMLREELALYPNEIWRYNDLDKNETLDSGMILYLQPKRFRAARGNDTHTVEEGETLWDISQLYGVKIRSLMHKNNLEGESEAEPGTELYLRKKVRTEERSDEPEEGEEPRNEHEMEFEFDGS